MPGAIVADPFSYLMLRVVPSVERGEQMNVGVVVFCRQRGFLGASVTVEEARLRGFAPGLEPRAVAEHLDGLVRVVRGDPTAGMIAALDASERFGWLAAPSSTIVQPSEVHTGLTADPQRTLTGLARRLIG